MDGWRFPRRRFWPPWPAPTDRPMSFSTDAFFFVLTVIAAVVYACFAVLRRNDPPERRKSVRFWGEILTVLFVIFMFRGFMFDWFRIPSGSMRPTLEVGDFVLVKKSAFGIRIPETDLRLTEGDQPARGDVIVFRKPGGNIFYIKRVIGIPGDLVTYRGKKVLVNRQEFNYAPLGVVSDPGESVLGGAREMPRLAEEIPGGGWHDILLDGDLSVFIRSPDRDFCSLGRAGNSPDLTCEVPVGHYFVLGDNRDHSQDSRFWGFVPRDRIVGPAVRVVFNFVDWDWERAWSSLKLRAGPQEAVAAEEADEE